MPREITKIVYTFQELLDGEFNSRVVDKARTDLIEVTTSHEWWEYAFEMWTQALGEIGFEEVKIQFSGFWSQGDGASFTATVDVPKLARFLATEIEADDRVDVVDGKEVFGPWLIHQIGGKPAPDPRYSRLAMISNRSEMSVVRNGHHCSHENTCDVAETLEERFTGTEQGSRSRTPRVAELWECFTADVDRLRIDLCRAIYNALEAEYEDITSDEALVEFAEANDFIYDRLGRLDFGDEGVQQPPVVKSPGKLLSPVPRKLLRQTPPKEVAKRENREG